MTREREYSLSQCVLIAALPLALAVAVAWLAQPRGVIDWSLGGQGWFVEYIVIWPLAFISLELWRAAAKLQPRGQPTLKSSLRLSGGLAAIYLFVWWLAVPNINTLAERLPGLNIAPASLSQLPRFILGVAGAVAIVLVREWYAGRARVAKE